MTSRLTVGAVMSHLRRAVGSALLHALTGAAWEADGVSDAPLNDGIWRYMTFVKFAALLETSRLWFARADTLGDPFEGSVPNWAWGKIHNVGNNRDEAPDSVLIDQWATTARRSRAWAYVSCWYGAVRDSAAMWTGYASYTDGVAIRSAVGALKRSLGVEDVEFRYVDYFPYDAETVPAGADPSRWAGNALELLFLKRDAFAHEHELRAVLMKPRIDDDAAPPGIAMPVDLKDLILEVAVAPFAEDWFKDLVEALAGRYKLAVATTRSDIGGDPNFRFAEPPGDVPRFER